MTMTTIRLWMVIAAAASFANEVLSSGDFINSFAVVVDGGKQEAEAIARDLGFVVQRELPNIGVFVLEHYAVSTRSKRSADSHLERLRSHPKVRYAQQETELIRVKRSIIHDKQMELPIREIKDNTLYHRVHVPTISTRDFEEKVEFNDPYYDDMWYLKNIGQSGGEKYLDMNVMVAWSNGFTGEGVVVCILDDGIDHTHADLTKNYDPKASADLNDKSDTKHDPMPNTTVPGNSHGTRCAGEVAALADNKVCGVGVAFNAKIGGIRVLDGTVTDSLEGEALRFNSDYIDIYSASWGPNDNGKTMEAPHFFAQEALKTGVQHGRKGLGSIFVWATGNGGLFGDDCNADGYVSSIETLSVGSTNDFGRQPFYMENCSSTMAVVPTGGEEYKGQERDQGKFKLKVVTTDVNNGCIENFQGTSSAAPLAAGCIANVLQANPTLTWRDVQHIVVRGARIPSVDSSWTINGGGHHVSRKFGFGMLDCGKMVKLAQDWIKVPEQHICKYDRANPQKLELKGNVTDSMYVDGCKGDKLRWIQRIEHVQLHIILSAHRRGNINIFLTSPSGTRSELLHPRPNDDFSGEWEFTFMTVHCWDESPLGNWKLEVYDNSFSSSNNEESRDLDTLLDILNNEKKSNNVGYVDEWSLTLYGTSGDRNGRHANRFKVPIQRAFKPSEEALSRIKREETEIARNIQVKRADIKRQNKKQIDANSEGSSDEIDEQIQSLLQKKESVTQVKRLLDERQKSTHDVSSFYHSDPQESDEENLHNIKKERPLGEMLRKLEDLLIKDSELDNHNFFHQKDVLDESSDTDTRVTAKRIWALLKQMEKS